jgi:hypothetical protein
MSNKNAKYKYFLVEIFVSVEVPDGMTREEFGNWHWDKISLWTSPTEMGKKVNYYRNVKFNNKVFNYKIPGANLVEVKE